jgi:hypothetical protein
VINTLISNFLEENEKNDLMFLFERIYSLDKNYFDMHIKNNIDVTFDNLLKIDRPVGRAVATVPPSLIPESVKKKIEMLASNINSNAKLQFASFVLYSKKYGDPQLVPHFDRPSKVCFLLDYQLYANKIWPLVIDGVEHEMADNDAVFLDATKSMHWRKPDIFLDNEEVAAVFFSFEDTNMEEPKKYWNQEYLDEAILQYEKDIDLRYTESMKLNYKKLLRMW